MSVPSKEAGGLPRSLELLVALAALTLLFPLLGVVAVLVKGTSAGPVIFRQIRIGKRGRRFALLKFRTMAADAEGFESTLRNGPQVTPVGRVLRKYKLDELPEFWNVVRGDMSLVGPRPEVPEYVDLGDPSWAGVLAVRPGLTDPVTLRLRDEERILAATDDKEAYYRSRLQPYKLRGYRDYLLVRTWETDVRILWETFLGALRPSRAPHPSGSKLRATTAISRQEPATPPRSRQAKWILKYRRLPVVLVHLGLIALSSYLAFWLRFDGQVPVLEMSIYLDTVVSLLVIRGLAFLSFGLYAGLWRYTSISDLQRIVYGVVGSSIVFYVYGAVILQLAGYPRSVYIIDALLLVCMMGGIRLGYRLRYEPVSAPASQTALIYGADTGGEVMARHLLQSPQFGYTPIGFIDDDPGKVGGQIHGVRVLGSLDDLPRILVEYDPDALVVGSDETAAARIEGAVESLHRANVSIVHFVQATGRDDNGLVGSVVPSAAERGGDP